MRKRLGVILPTLGDPLDYEMLQGFFDTAKALAYDVFVYTGIYNSHIDLQQDSYIHGLENIYTLPAKQRLDGILFAAERFHNEPVRRSIQRQLMQTDIPCLVMGEDLLPFESIQPRQQESMYRITKHLIEVHGCKTIYCISGYEGSRASEERIAGYRQAMHEAGLPVSDHAVFYGNFWKDIPAEIGGRIAAGSIPKPDAVVCASDVMAAALCESLIQNGISVPDDIRITGYDGGWDSFLNRPRITTIEGRERQYGADAVMMLHEMITGEPTGVSGIRQTIRYGESCGCDPARMHQNPNSALDAYFRARVRNQIQKQTFLASDLFAQTGGASDLNEWIEKIDSVGHVLQNWLWLDVCLCEDWCMDFAHPELIRQNGFSDRMLLALSKRRGRNAPDQYRFDTQEILPALADLHEPLLILMTSLHTHGQIFGYIASAYRAPEDIEPDAYYTGWCDAAAHGLYQLQQALYTEYRRGQMAVLSTHDPETGLYNRRGLAEHLHRLLQSEHGAPLLVMLSFSDAPHTAADYDTALLLANALRDIIPETGFLARMQPRVFALILQTDTDESECAVEIMSNAEHRMQHLLGTSNAALPHLTVLTQRLTADSLAQAAEAVESCKQAVLERVSAESGYAPDYKEMLLRLRSEITAEPQRDWNITDMAKEIGISRSHLQRLYKQYFSASCMDDIINARIGKAQKLLQYTELRIQEIAVQCGYRNESHFMRQFKEKCGITALQYRREHRTLPDTDS